jgi:uncharacterized protein (DUF2132 family)
MSPCLKRGGTDYTSMNAAGPNNPLHGIKLETILTTLVERGSWAELAEYTGIHCFLTNPSIKSGLKFLRTTPWARNKVEALYLEMICRDANETEPR